MTASVTGRRRRSQRRNFFIARRLTLAARHPIRSKISDISAEEATIGRGGVANLQQLRGFNTDAAALMAAHDRVEDARGEQRALHWVRRFASLEEFFQLDNQSIEEACARRLGQAKQARDRFAFAAQLGGEGEI